MGAQLHESELTVGGMADAAAFLDTFRRRHGRPLRVLHIGNVANNAYNNAKLMRKAGAECDVLCYNYYHIMGCPEWEDADFEAAPSDQFHPQWSDVDLGAYQRPQWFVQGPIAFCMAYLIAKLEGNKARADILWRVLGICNGTMRAEWFPRDPELLWALIVAHWARAKDFYRRVAISNDPWLAIRRRMGIEERARPTVKVLAAHATMGAVTVVRALDRVLGGKDRMRAMEMRVGRRAKELADAFAHEFPERGDRLTVKELLEYGSLSDLWSRLLSHYDIVQAYATDAIFPLVAGKPYFAFEHGTLREIPFNPDPVGRTTALSYRLAQHVFVTNADCMGKARQLAGERITFINHPYDDDQEVDVVAAERLRRELGERLDADFLIFFPTRHNWRPPNAEKANDVLLRAFCRLRAGGKRVGLVCCDWGADAPESKRILAENDCGAHVSWVQPLGMVRFGRMAKACDIVADQFVFGAFGGILFKAFAVGAPVLTYLDESAVLRVYPECPPVLNCRTEDEIVRAVEAAIASPGELRARARASKAWMDKHHHASLTVAKQIEQYRRFLEGE
ncbi:MAG: hypothetical protein M0015_13010 [Betaproteobacteria bacterium]|nr:hypothetical protein [Betaproteobacteria bacterium]